MGVTADEVRRAYEAESDHDRPVTHYSQVPTSYKAITPEWLTEVICRDTPGARVTSLSLDERDDGSSNRRRIFVNYNRNGIDAKLPETVFCKAAESLENRIVLGVSGTSLGEANFYNLVRHRIDLEAPRVRYARFDPKSFAYFIMMDDMTEGVRFCDERVTLSRV